MNIEYIERNGKVIVSNEFGEKVQKDKSDNIKEILTNENKSEFVYKLLQEYHSVKRHKIQPAIECAKILKFAGLGVLLFAIITVAASSLLTGANFLEFLSLTIGPSSKVFPTLVFYTFIGASGLIIGKIYKNKSNNIEEIIEELEKEQTNLRNEKYDLLRTNTKEKTNNIINLHSISLKEEFNNYYTEIEEKINQSESNYKPKTLSRIRKIK